MLGWLVACLLKKVFISGFLERNNMWCYTEGGVVLFLQNFNFEIFTLSYIWFLLRKNNANYSGGFFLFILLLYFWQSGILCTHLGEMSDRFARRYNIFEKSLRYSCDPFLFLHLSFMPISQSPGAAICKSFVVIRFYLMMPSVKCSVPEVSSHVSAWSHKCPT